MTTEKLTIDLKSPDGNAYSLLAYARVYENMLPPWMDFNDVETEMMSGDYEHLVTIFDKYFGHFIVLEK